MQVHESVSFEGVLDERTDTLQEADTNTIHLMLNRKTDASNRTATRLSASYTPAVSFVSPSVFAMARFQLDSQLTFSGPRTYLSYAQYLLGDLNARYFIDAPEIDAS